MGEEATGTKQDALGQMSKVAESVSADFRSRAVTTTAPPPEGAPPPEPVETPPPSVLPPEQKPPEPAATPPPETFDPNTIDINTVEEKSRSNFAKMRDLLKAKDTRITDLETQVGQREVNPEVLVEKDAQIKELTDQVAAYDVTATDDFKARFDAPMATMQTQLVANIQSFGKEEDEARRIAVQAISMPMAQRVAFLSEQVPEGAGALIPMFSTLETMQSQRQMAVDDFVQNRTARESEMQTVQEAQIQEQAKQQMQAAFAKARTDGYFMLSRSTGVAEQDQKWNDSVGQFEANAMARAISEDPAVHAENAVLASQTEALRDMVFLYMNQVKDLRDQFRARVGSEPTIGGGSGGPAPAPAPGGGGAGGNTMSAASAAADLATRVNNR